VRAGFLQARAGLAAGAAAAFEEAASIDPTDPLPGELFGALSAWPEEQVVSAEAASEAYADSARRRAALQQDDAELEDLWRAVAVDTTNDAAANELVKALEARGRLSAADEARREHARALRSAGDAALGSRASALESDDAERVVAADPKDARFVATLADSVTPGDRRAVAALEHAISLVGPRVGWCTALAETFEALGEVSLAVSWSQRLVALRPGDRAAIAELLARLVRAGDPSRLGDSLAWLLSQPQPVAWVAEPFGAALRALGHLDAGRAAVVARRTLDVLGPKSAVLRAAMFEVATLASDDAFAAAILERWLSSGAEGTDRRTLFADLAELRQRLGDEESEARVVAQAVREGLSSPEVDAHLVRLAARPASPDAQLWRAEALAMRLAGSEDRESAATALREFGAVLWDLASDRAGAISAWEMAARTAPSRGHATFADDLVAFWGADGAFEHLGRSVDGEADDKVAAAIAAGAARAALGVGVTRVAFDFAARGVARNPLSAEALELAERAADSRADLAALSGLYDLVGARSLGRFGRRAAHYRGARFFERRAEAALALKHAARAFYAVPSEGSSFHLLARAAERAGDAAEAMRTVEQVAENAPHAEARSAWLLRAADLAGEGIDGSERRVDVFLRAIAISPSASVIARLRNAAGTLLGLAPARGESLAARIDGVLRAVSEAGSGPEGARVAIACARTSLELFADSEGALRAVERAFACDADVDEFDELIPWGPALGFATGARERVTALLASAETGFANLGLAALRLLDTIAVVLADEPLRGRISVAAAMQNPEEAPLVLQADAVVRRVPELEERLGKRVSRARRAAVLCAAARVRASEGAHAEAALLFERAVDVLEPAARPQVERELRAAWDAAGQGAETEARVQKEAASESGSPSARADRWMEIAQRREVRGDTMGAVRALVEACRLDPGPLERWSALERVAEAAGDLGARVEAMEAIALRVDARGQIAVFKRLAHVHDRGGDLAAAEHSWRRVLALDPQDEEADHAIEAMVVARGRYDELADHLKRRADRLGAQSEKREMLRAVRLRLAAILEQRLGRVEEACDELAVLLAEWPDNPGALRYLADLLDRLGQPARSAPFWARAASVETDLQGRSDLEVKTARAWLAAGDLRAAAQHASRALAARSTNVAALEVRIDVARAAGADRDLGDALDAMATGGEVDGLRVGDLLLEAAQAAARAGDSDLALDRARRAADAVPERATPQLLARGLEYRLRGAGTGEDARRTVHDLSGIREPLDGPDAALRAFLLAEALDVAHGEGRGLRELEAACASAGNLPLIALGLAERFAAQGLSAVAVDAYTVALEGPLLDLRKTGAVALAAAEAAIQAHRLQDAARFLDMAEGEAETQAAAQAARAILIERATATARPSSVAERTVGPGDERLAELEATVRAAGSPVSRANARLALGRIRLERGDARGAEPLLWEALADGLAGAGDVLAPMIAAAPDRARDLVRLRRQQVGIEPGSLARLQALRAAALADDDRVYAAAVEHVLRAFDPGAGPLPPPPLAAQPEQPGIFALLTRPALDGAGEALASIWEGALHLFVRDPASYGITGLERVAPGPTSTLTRLYEVATRVLDLPRIPLFAPRASAGAPSAQVALLSPPSVVLTGDARDETLELRFALGYGLSATLPQNVLRLGLPRAEGRALVEAIHAAFGPPEIGRRVDARAARLAQSFWQTVPPRTQRRLQQILATGPLGEYEDLVARAHQSGLRAGMFLAGDFGWAARHLLAESPHSAEASAASAEGLSSLCADLPMLADLLRLAVSPEYADARWHAVPPGLRPGNLSSRGFRFF
jgi:tetratricopeptide (TPR) repeat protein